MFIKKGVLLVVLLMLFSGFASAALGITPAKKEFSYKPGERIEIGFKIISDKPDRVIELYAEGDFENHTTFSKQTVTGEETFKVYIDFPPDNGSFKPGRHSLLIGAKEFLPESERQFFSTQINVRALVVILVPYPGKFAEVELNVPDGNVNEKIPVEVKVTGRGKESILTDVKVYFYENSRVGDPVFIMNFQPVTIGTDEQVFFRKVLNTEGYKPGVYFAEAIADYSEDRVNASQTFRIGSVFVNITNFTETLPRGGIREFYIGIESQWNNEFDGVFADVNVSNANESVVFRTPSIYLKRWEKSALVGFLDTTDLRGKYNTEIVLHYVDKMTVVNGVLLIISYVKIIIAVIIIAVVCCIVAYVIWRRRKQNAQKKK